MVTLTERAGAVLQQMRAEQGLSEPLRIISQGGQLTLTAAPPDPEDEILYHDETPVLSVPPEAANALAGSTITTEDTPNGTRLAIVPAGSAEGGP